jgi:hypothetical protein
MNVKLTAEQAKELRTAVERFAVNEPGIEGFFEDGDAPLEGPREPAYLARIHELAPDVNPEPIDDDVDDPIVAKWREALKLTLDESTHLRPSIQVILRRLGAT